MAAAAPIAAIASIGAMGLSAYGSYEKGKGEQAADEYKAQSLERAAEVGRVKAAQTGAQMTEKLNQTLGNIDAVRAAAHDDPTSPTGAAIRDLTEARGERAKSITVDNILEQVDQDTADAAYMRTAGQYALLSGEVGAGGTVLGGIGKMLGGLN
jgi:hypothetical protein